MELKKFTKVITRLWVCQGVNNPRIVEQRRGVMNFLLEKMNELGTEDPPEDQMALIRDRVEWLIDNPTAGCEVIKKSI